MNINFHPTAADFFFVSVLIAVSWTTGIFISRRSEHAAGEMAQRAEDSSASSAMPLERAVAEERQRIARELHDVIAHSVSS